MDTFGVSGSGHIGARGPPASSSGRSSRPPTLCLARARRTRSRRQSPPSVDSSYDERMSIRQLLPGPR